MTKERAAESKTAAPASDVTVTVERISGDECHDIFIVPIGRDDKGARYEAVFN